MLRFIHKYTKHADVVVKRSEANKSNMICESGLMVWAYIGIDLHFAVRRRLLLRISVVC